MHEDIATDDGCGNHTALEAKDDVPGQIAGRKGRCRLVIDEYDIGRAALDQVSLLHKEKKNPETLSAGEQQRVGIARAIVTRPKLLIADEPTGNLDPDLSLEVMRIFRRFNEVGVTLLIASHDIALIDKLGCRRIELDGGKLQRPEDTYIENYSDVPLPQGGTDQWQ